MSNLSTLTLLIFAFAPMVLTFGVLSATYWISQRKHGAAESLPQKLLSAAVSRMPADREEWGRAMLAELRGIWSTPASWWFAINCSRIAFFPPPVAGSPRSWRETITRLKPNCGLLSVALPLLGLPLLYFSAIAAETLTTHDNFFNGELIPGMVGILILVSIALILAGVPLGIAGLVKHEKQRWLSLTGPLLSVSIFSYLQIVQYIAGTMSTGNY